MDLSCWHTFKPTLVSANAAACNSDLNPASHFQNVYSIKYRQLGVRVASFSDHAEIVISSHWSNSSAQVTSQQFSLQHTKVIMTEMVGY